MKIGLVCPDPFYFPGGIQQHVKFLYRALKKRGHSVKVIAPRYSSDEYYGKDFILLGKSRLFSANASQSHISSRIKKEELRKLLERENFDILHFHNIGLFMQIQIFMNSKSINIITVHGLPDAIRLYKFTYRLINYLVKNYVINNLHGLIAVSKPILKFLPKNLKKIKMRIIPNGIDLEVFNPKNKKIKRFLDGKINILFVGRMDKRKGLNYLIDAYNSLKKKYENVRLIVVGEGNYEKKWRKKVKKKKVKDVVFVGYVKDSKLPNYYTTADIFCSPATHGESFGIVLLEAMASGIPIVAFANKGYKSVLQDKGRKFLVKPKNTKELTKKLEKLIINEKLRKEMGEWGLKEVKKYSWEKISKQVENFYKEVFNYGKRN